MDDISPQPLQTVGPEDLGALIALAKEERWTELILLGPDRLLSADRENWPEPYRLAPRVFQTTEPIGDDGARAIAALTGLHTLHLDSNNIGPDGARAIAALTSLTSLNLDSNEIGPDGARAIAALTGLTSLNLRHNEIGPDGARAIAALTGLTSLVMNLNKIGPDGARAIAALTGLTSLNLSYNEIGPDGARAIAALTGLTSLNLDSNGIGADGARAIAALTGLTTLHLNNNNIGDDGARAIAALTGLTSLNLNSNGIGADGARAILDAWSMRAETDHLRYLDLQKNGDLSALLPEEVLANTGDPKAILAAYRRIVGGDTQALNEAKLLVVGNEAVGKTSLLRYLIDGEPRDPSEQKTPGIATHEKIKTETWAPAAGDIRLNVWDFGGQEMMRGTHRFFLTARSLYLLVLEDRREDDRSIVDWLKIIRNRAAGSPILVIINKSDEGKEALRLDKVSLREDYPEIIGFLRTSCNDDEFSRNSLQTLRNQIVDAVVNDDRLKHVRNPFPQSWIRVKDEVTALAAKLAVLPLSKFQTICEAGKGTARNVTDEDERRSLLRLLNDLGTIVAHGLEPDARAVQREITLLDPNWLTQAIYKILTSADCADLQGEFTGKHVTAWLDTADYPPERHEFILDMMQDDEVGLCFQLPGEGEPRFLVPEALPANSPFLKNWPADCLHFRYRYDFLPRSLVPRFIVQAHELLATPPTRWRTGAVFEVQDCPILVIADTDKEEINILVDGPKLRRRSALAIITSHLETIHAKNPETKPVPRVPLPDQPDVDVGYDYLLKLEAKYDPDYELDPEGANREAPYTVAELLDGVRHEQRLSRKEPREEGSRYEINAQNVNISDGQSKNDVRQAASVGEESSPLQKKSASSSISWRSVSALCAAAAAIVTAFVLFQFEGLSTAYVLTGAVVAAVITFLIVAYFNPDYAYRRLLALTAGMLAAVNVGGTALKLSFVSESISANVQWDGSIPWSFNLTMGIIIVVLGALEWQRMHKTG